MMEAEKDNEAQMTLKRRKFTEKGGRVGGWKRAHKEIVIHLSMFFIARGIASIFKKNLASSLLHTSFYRFINSILHVERLAVI